MRSPHGRRSGPNEAATRPSGQAQARVRRGGSPTSEIDRSGRRRHLKLVGQRADLGDGWRRCPASVFRNGSLPSLAKRDTVWRHVQEVGHLVGVKVEGMPGCGLAAGCHGTPLSCGGPDGGIRPGSDRVFVRSDGGRGGSGEAGGHPAACRTNRTTCRPQCLHSPIGRSAYLLLPSPQGPAHHASRRARTWLVLQPLVWRRCQCARLAGLPTDHTAPPPWQTDYRPIRPADRSPPRYLPVR